MGVHTHDEIDWAERVGVLRRSDRLHADTHREIARRLVGQLPDEPTVVDVGCGTGGMSAAFAEALRERGGTVTLVDAVPVLLTEAEAEVRAAAGDAVRVTTVLADAADDQLLAAVPAAQLVWASRMVHHLPDQQAGLRRLLHLVREGGTLALAEGGLEPCQLPWDLGVGQPGLERRLQGAQGRWFVGMRSGMDGAVRMPYGWPVAMTEAGLTGVGSFGVLTDHPAPAGDEVRDAACDRLAWLAEVGKDWLDDTDLQAVRRLADPADPAYLGTRDDIFWLSADTVHYGRRPGADRA